MRTLFAGALVVIALWATSVDARLVALVIGNDNYQGAPVLRNSRTDAQAVGKSLVHLGFEVTVRQDATLEGMRGALGRFREGIRPGDEAVFYFSGHAVQIAGANFLIPIDLVAQSAVQVADESVPLGRVLEDMREQKARFSLTIIDACRDNPFKRAVGLTGGLIGSTC